MTSSVTGHRPYLIPNSPGTFHAQAAAEVAQLQGALEDRAGRGEKTPPHPRERPPHLPTGRSAALDTAGISTGLGGQEGQLTRTAALPTVVIAGDAFGGGCAGCAGGCAWAGGCTAGGPEGCWLPAAGGWGRGGGGCWGGGGCGCGGGGGGWATGGCCAFC